MIAKKIDGVLFRPVFLAACSLLASAQAGAAGGVEKILYASEVSGNYEIYSMNPDGTGAAQLTTSTAKDYFPAVSPDGAKIAYVCEQPGSTGLWVMESDGSNRRFIAGDTSLFFVWSLDSSRIYFVRNLPSDTGVWSIKPDGSDEQNHYSTGASSPVFRMQKMSPDGLSVLCERISGAITTKDIVRIRLSDGLLTELVANDGVEQHEPQVLVMGDPILYHQWNGTSNIWRMEQDGSAKLELAPGSALARWMSDGRILYASYADPREIFVMNANGSNQVNLTNNPANDWNPAPSFDASKAFFVSDRTGYYAIWSMDINGSNLVRLTGDVAQNTELYPSQLVYPSPTATPCSSPRVDNFDGPSFDPAFSYTDTGGVSGYSFSGGSVTWNVAGDENYAWGVNTNAPRLMADVTGDFIAEGKFELLSTNMTNYFGIAALSSNPNYSGLQNLALHHEFGTSYVTHEHYGNVPPNYDIALGQNVIWLRLVREGNRFKSFYSLDGTVWSSFRDQTEVLPATIPVGIMLKSNIAGTFSARSEYFRIDQTCLSPTPTGTVSPSPTLSMTLTESPTQSQTPTVTPTVSATHTSTITPTATITATVTPAYSATAGIPDPGDTPYVFPHPFRCGSSVGVKMHKPGRCKVSLMTSRGNLIEKKEFRFGPGVNAGKFDCDRMDTGLKFMVVEIEYDDGDKVRLKPVRIAVTQ